MCGENVTPTRRWDLVRHRARAIRALLGLITLGVVIVGAVAVLSPSPITSPPPLPR